MQTPIFQLIMFSMTTGIICKQSDYYGMNLCLSKISSFRGKENYSTQKNNNNNKPEVPSEVFRYQNRYTIPLEGILKMTQ